MYSPSRRGTARGPPVVRRALSCGLRAHRARTRSLDHHTLARGIGPPCLPLSRNCLALKLCWEKKLSPPSVKFSLLPSNFELVPIPHPWKWLRLRPALAGLRWVWRARRWPERLCVSPVPMVLGDAEVQTARGDGIGRLDDGRDQGDVPPPLVVGSSPSPLEVLRAPSPRYSSATLASTALGALVDGGTTPHALMGPPRSWSPDEKEGGVFRRWRIVVGDVGRGGWWGGLRWLAPERNVVDR